MKSGIIPAWHQSVNFLGVFQLFLELNIKQVVIKKSAYLESLKHEMLLMLKKKKQKSITCRSRTYKKPPNTEILNCIDNSIGRNKIQ